MGILTDKTCSRFWEKLNCRVRRTGAILTTLNLLRAKILYEWNNLPQNYVQRYLTSMRRRCIAVGTYPLLSLHGHGRCCRILLKNIVIFTLFCDVFDQVWSLLKFWKKCELRFYQNFEFCVRIFLTFYFIRNKINAIL